MDKWRKNFLSIKLNFNIERCVSAIFKMNNNYFDNINDNIEVILDKQNNLYFFNKKRREEFIFF